MKSVVASSKKKLTVAELIALKGQRKLVLCTAFDEFTARAAEAAGVDMIVSWGADFESTKYVVGQVRKGAPNTLIGSGINPGAYVSAEEALRLAEEIRAAGTDIIYCSGLVPAKFGALSKQHYPCCGHVGYLPVNDTWLGGPRAVGKTAAEAEKLLTGRLREPSRGLDGLGGSSLAKGLPALQGQAVFRDGGREGRVVDLDEDLTELDLGAREVDVETVDPASSGNPGGERRMTPLVHHDAPGGVDLPDEIPRTGRAETDPGLLDLSVRELQDAGLGF